jgi:hypothetical protein
MDSKGGIVENHGADPHEDRSELGSEALDAGQVLRT